MKMMYCLASLSLAVSGSAFAWGDFAGISYQGKGEWSTPDGQSGSYTVATRVAFVAAANGVEEYQMETNYAAGGAIQKITYSFAYDAAKHSFDVFSMDNGQRQRIGAGYCVKSAPACHYSVNLQGRIVEQSFDLQEGKLYKVGSVVNNDHSRALTWSETLSGN